MLCILPLKLCAQLDLLSNILDASIDYELVDSSLSLHIPAHDFTKRYFPHQSEGYDFVHSMQIPDELKSFVDIQVNDLKKTDFLVLSAHHSLKTFCTINIDFISSSSKIPRTASVLLSSYKQQYFIHLNDFFPPPDTKERYPEIEDVDTIRIWVALLPELLKLTIDELKIHHSFDADQFGFSDSFNFQGVSYSENLFKNSYSSISQEKVNTSFNGSSSAQINIKEEEDKWELPEPILFYLTDKYDRVALEEKDVSSIDVIFDTLMIEKRKYNDHLQFILIPQIDLEDIHWTIDYQKHTYDKFKASLYAQPLVKREINTRYTHSYTSTYLSDPLVEIDKINFWPQDKPLGFWLELDGELPGEELIEVTFYSKGNDARKLNLKILPQSEEDLNEKANAKPPIFISQFYDLGLKDFKPFLRNRKVDSSTSDFFDEFLLQNGIQPGNIYSYAPPNWDEAHLKKLLDLGLRAINLAYVRIDRKDIHAFSESAHWDRLDQQTIVINQYKKKLTELGLWNHPDLLLYINLFDEWPTENSDILYRTAQKLKESFPTVKLMTTAFDFTFSFGSEYEGLIDIWIPHYDQYKQNYNLIQYLQQKGWLFYTYLAVGSYPPSPNLWLESSLKSLDHFFDHEMEFYHIEGFMYWANNRWFSNSIDDMKSFPFTHWNAASYGNDNSGYANGEGSLFYAVDKAGEIIPVTSKRLKIIKKHFGTY